MLSVYLHHLKFHAFHGLYEAEKISGNDFEVNVELGLPASGKIKHLEQTIDYVAVYSIIKERMQTATPLLETVAQDLAEIIHHADRRIKHISISIKKLSPPIKNCTGTVGVTFKKIF